MNFVHFQEKSYFPAHIMGSGLYLVVNTPYNLIDL